MNEKIQKIINALLCIIQSKPQEPVVILTLRYNTDPFCKLIEPLSYTFVGQNKLIFVPNRE